MHFLISCHKSSVSVDTGIIKRPKFQIMSSVYAHKTPVSPKLRLPTDLSSLSSSQVLYSWICVMSVRVDTWPQLWL